MFLGKPKVLVIEITPVCNLKCIYCYEVSYVPQNRQPIEFETLKQVFFKAKSLGITTVVISGGEPTLYNHKGKSIVDILGYAKSLGMRVIILTNGVIPSKIYTSLFEFSESGVIKEIRVAFDGIDVQEITRPPSTSKQILKTIDKLKQHKVNVSISTQLTKLSLPTLLETYKAIMKKRNLPWRIDIPFLYGRWEEGWKKYGVLPNDLVENTRIFRELVKNYIYDFSGKYSEIPLSISKIFMSKILVTKKFYTYNINEHPCSYNHGMVTIHANGDVGFCPTLSRIFGNINTLPFEKIVHNLYSSEFMKLTIGDIKGCLKCKYLRICGGGCRADALYINNDIHVEDSFACAGMKVLEQLLDLFPRELKNEFHKYVKSE